MKLTLTDIAVLLPVTIDFLESYGLDYYQNGQISLEDACLAKGLDFSVVDHELNEWIAVHEEQRGRNLMELDIQEVIAYINGTFHASEMDELLSLETLIAAFAQEEKKDNNLIYLARNISIEFKVLKDKMMRHFEDEDRTFFPYILQLIEARKAKLNLPTYQISLIKNPIRILEREHQQALCLLEEIKDLTHNFADIENSGKHYTTLMAAFRQFERNMHLHFHIENNILFPKLHEMETELMQKVAEKYH